MSTKPSLYVVERKEVVVLVTLFVLVTVLAFTLGVKYGESLGRKAYLQDSSVHDKMNEELAGHGGSGTLGAEHPSEAAPEHAEKAAEHGEAHEEGHAEGHEEAAAPHEAAVAAHGETHGEAHTPSPEELAKAAPRDEPKTAVGLKDRPKEPVDTNSDAHLLNALHEAGIQPSKGGAAEAGEGAKASQLPNEAKTIKPQNGAFTIQVGSYPTKADAEAQLKHLKEEKLSAMMLAPVSEHNGEWFRVTVGNYGTKLEAERAAKQIQAKGQIKSYFVRKLN